MNARSGDAMTEHPDNDTIEWIKCVLKDALQDEALIVRMLL